MRRAPDPRRPAARPNRNDPPTLRLQARPRDEAPAPTQLPPAVRKAADVGVRATRKRLRRFLELGWCANSRRGLDAVAIDIGSESLCVTRFDGSFMQARDQAQPTLARVVDPHAFRSREPFSLELGLPALERWPRYDVLRGTHGSVQLPSQIGLTEFPAEHALAAIVGKLAHDAEAQPRQLVLTLPTFFPRDLDARIRALVAPFRKGAFPGVPAPMAAAYFYLAPAIDGIQHGARSLPSWAQDALDAGRVLLLDWGASGLHYGLVSVRQGSPHELRLHKAGTWASLGGHRLALQIVGQLRALLIEEILNEGPSEDLVPRALARGPLGGAIPRPPGYERAFERLRELPPRSDDPTLRAERDRLENLVFPTAWRWPSGQEPDGFAPYRALAILHFKALWQEANRLKRLILADPDRCRRRQSLQWSLDPLESPFISHLAGACPNYEVEWFLSPLEAELERALAHLDRRLHRTPGPLHVGLLGRQAATPLLGRTLEQGQHRGALAQVEVCPHSTDPLELKSVVNRGAALLNRDRRKVSFGLIPDVLPYSVDIADCLGNVTIFPAGPIDELRLFQRRLRVEDGLPRLEYYVYTSEDGSQRGSWGVIDFDSPFDFAERDRVFAVDPRYGFGGSIPTLRDLHPSPPNLLASRCFDRARGGHGEVSFRTVAPRSDARARRLLHFLEYGLKGEFHRKVYLLEREFEPPPRRFDQVIQRYYLSRSQELLVVREGWFPGPGGTLQRRKTLHSCQGSTDAHTILGIEWGTPSPERRP